MPATPAVDHYPTVQMPALRLMPPTQPDRRDGWKLTRRGQFVAKCAAGASILGFAIAAQPLSEAFWSLSAALSQIAGVQ